MCVVLLHISVGIYCYGTHLVTSVDIMGIIVKKDVHDKINIYAGKDFDFSLFYVVYLELEFE